MVDAVLRKYLLRGAIVAVVAFLLLGDCAGVLRQLVRGRRASEGTDTSAEGDSPKYRAAGTGYGDTGIALHLDADIEDASLQQLGTKASRSQMLSTIKNACLPKLICELNASPHKDRLTHSERSLLSLIRDTSISVTAELTSKYHFAAHMGQLITGVDGNGCHNFYPTCPFPGMQVLQMMKKVRMR